MGAPVSGTFSHDCEFPACLPELDGVCRTLPPIPRTSTTESVYQFEDLSPVLDEDDNRSIFDDLKK
jgi:hypothetical protein